eukprot:2809995-Prymnesium_polylepis.1
MPRGTARVEWPRLLRATHVPPHVPVACPHRRGAGALRTQVARVALAESLGVVGRHAEPARHQRRDPLGEARQRVEVASHDGPEGRQQRCVGEPVVAVEAPVRQVVVRGAPVARAGDAK